MIKTLRESKAKLSELVDLASRGEEVLISVRGRVKARLIGITPPARDSDRTSWATELKRLQKSYSRAATQPTVEEILAEYRRDQI